MATQSRRVRPRSDGRANTMRITAATSSRMVTVSRGPSSRISPAATAAPNWTETIAPRTRAGAGNATTLAEAAGTWRRDRDIGAIMAEVALTAGLPRGSAAPVGSIGPLDQRAPVASARRQTALEQGDLALHARIQTPGAA